MDMSPSVNDSSVANLPLSDPRCIAAAESCIAFYAAENRSQELLPFAIQFKYGHWTNYYYVAVILVLSTTHFVNLWQDRRRSTRSTEYNTSFYQKAQAAGRYIAYRRIKIRPLNALGLPPYGILAFLLSTILFLVVLTFAVKPYYRDHLGYGSPPLAIRSGLMAFACTPILIALAGKANVITLLTGVSHEKLNIFHRWVAWMCFGLSMVHTVPFFIASYKDGGYANVKMQFCTNISEGANEYSGVAPLTILFGLCILSLPPIRRHFYETFYNLHIFLAISYLGLLFYHAGNVLDSWAYLWATLALWLASIVARTFWYTRPLNISSQWFTGSPTSLQSLPGNMTKLEVLAPHGFKYSPAQHCFLRFPNISLLDNHPFTITSPPYPICQTCKEANALEKDYCESLVFLTRTHLGFTQKLASYCASNPEALASAWIDGPYGGLNRPIERIYDTLILIAGGTGISACLPWLLHVVAQTKTVTGTKPRTKRIVLVWAMKEASHLTWVKDALESLDTENRHDLAVQISLYITGRSSITTFTSSSKSVQGNAVRKGIEDTIEEMMAGPSHSNLPSSVGEYLYGRPEIGTIIQELICPGKTLVFGCGPKSLQVDIADTCAKAQIRVLRGEVQEVGMHLEAFEW